MREISGVAALVVLVAMSGVSGSATAATDRSERARGVAERPNVVVVMADDMRADDLRFMPHVRRLVAARGLTYENTFSPYPLCCPARASFLTGQYAHNHRVLGNAAPYGFGGFDDSATVATSLQEAGYRTAFVAGCRTVIARLTTVRKHAGLMLPQPLQQAMIAALRDDVHVAEQKQRYRARRDLLKPALEAAGFRIDHSEAGLYLWATEGRDAWESIGRLADLGIVGGPGHFYGVHFPEHVRLSLTATDERVRAAASRLQGSAPA